MDNRTEAIPDETYHLAERLLRVFVSLGKLAQYRIPEGVSERLNVTQIRILHQLAHHPHLSQKELAAHLEITPAAISQAVRALTEAGLVERQPDPADTRVWRLSLSPRGRELIACVQEARRTAVARLLSGLPLDEQRTVVEALERALHNLKNHNQEEHS